MTQPARLTGDLLARKGQAYSAAGFAEAGSGLPQPLLAARAPARPCGPDTSRLLERSVSWPAARPDQRRATADDRVALTLRLDPVLHARLKIFAARRRRSCQDVMSKALHAYLQACGPDCACMHGEMERTSGG